MSERQPAAELIHHAYQPPAGFASPAVAVHKGSSIFFENVAALKRVRWADRDAYTYGLHGTPSTFALEARLATLEGAEHVLLAPSGLAALNLVNHSLLKSGDQLLIPDNVYGPSRNSARHELAAWGIAHAVYDPLDPADLAAKLTPATRLVWLEAPGSITLEFPDLLGLIAAVRAGAPQALVALDNTWGAGLAFDAFALGVDLTIHALTKYPSGGGDVLMGSVATRDRALFERLAATHGRSGLGVGGNDVELVLRGLASLPLRYAAQDAAARQVAAWAQQHPAVAQVLHPALPGSPGHVHWKQLCRAAAGLLTLRFQPGTPGARIEAAVDALRVFRLAWSWGGPVSLAVPYDLTHLRSVNRSEETVLRLAIGLEEPEVLIADLAQAFEGL
ncbi:PLP-dependent transferase [Inhella proteolytica]|uniref:PLP-dependent transferase n=1 Tax=Inhella proteolytica TaxID=2795029 RepID=A0A931J573_9BURK|nr:PLP-dependent transferase [Inhella proteolytica]MBH9577754.1 PLP-dependent transferase [Inhella proteolytica]